MINSPKITLLNNIDDLDLEFIDGENDMEFEIDDYSFTVTYSLEDDEVFSDEEEETKVGKKLTVISINAYDNLEEQEINVNVDDTMQKLFSDYYFRTLTYDAYNSSWLR